MKKRMTQFVRLGAALVVGMAVANTAQAGGISLYEIGTPDVGSASAGYAARADDASTLFKNPAGMSRLGDAQVQGGLQGVFGSVEFTPNGSTSARLGTEDGDNAVGWIPGGSLFAVVPLGEKWHVGIGTLSYFGLAEKYEDDWVGRYYVQQGAILGMSVMPSVSFQATDWLSIGAGLNAMFGYFNTEMAVNNGLGPDGKMKLEDGTWGFGANVGVLLQFSEKTRLGVTYLSPVELNFKDTPEFEDLGPALANLLANPSALDLGATVPQSVMVSLYQALNDKWAVMADFGWQDWSEFGYVQAGVESGGTTTLNLKCKDTWHGALGVQCQATDKILLSGGVAFDSSAVDSANRTVTLPMGQSWRVGVGAQYQVSQAINVGAATTFMWTGNMAVDQGSDLSLRGRVAGSYDDAWFSITTVNLTWKF